MSQIEIVEYQPTYAKAIAEMWNRSSSGWNGRQFNKTEQIVLQEEENSPYLNLYLAVDDTLVIGYASFARYAEEKGVSYIEMLSVDPAWHGKGIGRQLVQKCVLRAAELNYERIDLFTWAGNTKAVPLYKKCGFFWEKMESQATHLMNFIPGLLNNEYLKPYFEYFDWYKDSKRPLEIEPDGRPDNGFDLFDYIWEKDGKQLQVTFEKSGRGIVYLSTPELEISTHTTDAKPIFGLDYDYSYHINSKDGKKIQITINGESDQQVDYSFTYHDKLNSETTLKSTYFIQPLDDDISEWLTSPSVVSKLTIDGKSIRFKTGLKIQYPLETMFRMGRNQILPNTEKEVFLNIWNHFSIPCSYRIELTDEEPLVLKKKIFEVDLQPQEKSFIPIEFVTNESCIFNPTLTITARPEGMKEIEFVKSLEIPIFTLTSKAQCKLPNKYYLLNGSVMLLFIQKEQKNWGYLCNTYGQNFNLCPPLLGKPYSDEFEREAPYHVEVEDLGYANRLILFYRSHDFKGVEFARTYTLYPTGMMECTIRIINIPDEYTDVLTKFTIGMEGKGLIFKQNGKIIRIEKELIGADTSSFEGEEIGSNWIYSEYDDASSAVIWDPKWKGFFDKWWISWEINLSEYKARGVVETEPLRLFLNSISSSYVVQRLAEGVESKAVPIYPSLEMLINNGAPFIRDSFDVKLIQHKNENLKGDFILQSEEGKVPLQKTTCSSDEEREIVWSGIQKPDIPMEIIRCEARMPLLTQTRNQVILVSKGSTRLFSQEDRPELRADNGLITITAASDARLPGLISLKYEGQEWLDQAYPEFKIKSYFNPYPGGMKVIPVQMRMANMLSETHETRFASLTDQWGNIWEGIAVRTSIRNMKMLEGLVYEQYFVMLPGVPVMAIVPLILKSDGYAEYFCLQVNSHFNPTGDTRDVTIRIPLEDKSKVDYHAGTDSFFDRVLCRQITVLSDKIEHMLNLVTLTRSYNNIHLNPEICESKLNLYSEFNESKEEFLESAFILFSKLDLEQEWMYPLLNTEFKQLEIAAFKNED
ncbi:MAG TPA: GNAT family N-acetyltransferase [Candidatus Cloacimonadota bacterium]|nr:GNAT family N-acetyltransferase [Candidatus Cloacimonadota bacterium]